MKIFALAVMLLVAVAIVRSQTQRFPAVRE